MIVIYLSNRTIRVIDGVYTKGTVKIKGLYHTVDQNGCIINGTIADKEGLQKKILELWEKEQLPKKDVALVINSSQVTSKVLDVPKMNHEQTLGYVAREFADVSRIEDSVYMSDVLSEDKKAKMRTLFAGVASRAFLQGYQQMFEEIGIQISRIEGIRGPLFRMIGSLEQVKGHTCIFQMISESTLVNVLYVKGKYVYSDRVRLFSDPDMPEFAVEVARSLGQMLQFAKSQNIEEPIHEVYGAGMRKNALEVFLNSTHLIDENLEVCRLERDGIFLAPNEEIDEQLEEYALALGAFWPGPEKSGFLAQLLYDPEARARSRKRRKVVVPLAALAAVLGVTAIGLGVQTWRLGRQLDEAPAYNESETVKEACEKYDRVRAQVGVKSRLLTESEKLGQMIDGYPVVDSRTNAVVASCANGLVSASIVEYDALDGMLSIDTMADQVEKIHLFVGRLEDEELFEKIEYTGYSQTGEGNWTMTITCRMRGSQEENNDTETDGER